MNQESIWTSTGVKILHHPSVLRKIIDHRIALPISLQISPTSKCNLRCSFCSNINREKDEQLPFETIKRLMLNLCLLSLKTVEWTGGGDPTLYPFINEVINLADRLHLKQGLITNGIKLKENITHESLNALHWIRISLNCLDYVEDIELPKIKGVLGFSYVMNEETSPAIIKKLVQYAKDYNPSYVRIVPNCLSSNEEQIRNNKILSEMIKDWGSPFFYQAKVFEQPKNCWWGYLKPFVNHDGSVFRCSSIVLNPDADRTFHEKYKWCNVEELHSMYTKEMVPFDPRDCPRCVFSNQNNLIESLMTPNGQEAFI